MKKILLIIAFGYGLLLSGNFIYAGPELETESEAEPENEELLPLQNSTEEASGEIVMMDPVNNKLILKEASGKVSYTVGNHVKIFINEKVLKFNQLKTAQKITVHFKKEGNEKLIVSIMDYSVAG